VNNADADIGLIRAVDELESRAESYLTLEAVEQAVGFAVSEQIARGILLVDRRHRPDGNPVHLCRLNRHHPLVVKLTSW
jgi:hypothetical protein